MKNNLKILISNFKSYNTLNIPINIYGQTGRTSFLKHLIPDLIIIDSREITDTRNLSGFYAIENGDIKYIEGILIDALKQGKKLFIKNVDFNMNILYFLNSYIQNKIVQSNKGEIVYAHPEFRLYFSSTERIKFNKVYNIGPVEFTFSSLISFYFKREECVIGGSRFENGNCRSENGGCGRDCNYRDSIDYGQKFENGHDFNSCGESIEDNKHRKNTTDNITTFIDKDNIQNTMNNFLTKLLSFFNTTHSPSCNLSKNTDCYKLCISNSSCYDGQSFCFSSTRNLCTIHYKKILQLINLTLSLCGSNSSSDIRDTFEKGNMHSGNAQHISKHSSSQSSKQHINKHSSSQSSTRSTQSSKQNTSKTPDTIKNPLTSSNSIRQLLYDNTCNLFLKHDSEDLLSFFNLHYYPDIILYDTKITKTYAYTLGLRNLICNIKSNKFSLLVGETGTGKTSLVQYLSSHSEQYFGYKTNLKIVNMSPDYDGYDLVGGYSTIDINQMVNELFIKCGISKPKLCDNLKCLEMLREWCCGKGNVCIGGDFRVDGDSGDFRVDGAMKEGSCLKNDCEEQEYVKDFVYDEEKKKEKLINTYPNTNNTLQNPNTLLEEINLLEKCIKNKTRFIWKDGLLVQAMREGHWILLDEINLCSTDTLNMIEALLSKDTIINYEANYKGVCSNDEIYVNEQGCSKYVNEQGSRYKGTHVNEQGCSNYVNGGSNKEMCNSKVCEDNKQIITNDTSINNKTLYNKILSPHNTTTSTHNQIHPNFMLFACMNPLGTGKKNFNTVQLNTINFHDFTINIHDIYKIVNSFNLDLNSEKLAEAFYEIKRLISKRELTNKVEPVLTGRTLVRALSSISYVVDVCNTVGNDIRDVYSVNGNIVKDNGNGKRYSTGNATEHLTANNTQFKPNKIQVTPNNTQGTPNNTQVHSKTLLKNICKYCSVDDIFSVFFLTQFDLPSRAIVSSLLEEVNINKCDNKNCTTISNCYASNNKDSNTHSIKDSKTGSNGNFYNINNTNINMNNTNINTNNYIVTTKIKILLRDILTAINLNMPVLLQGDTSTGKTSIIYYLADMYNKKVIRINNHEQTESSDYIGTYVSLSVDEGDCGDNLEGGSVENCRDGLEGSVEDVCRDGVEGSVEDVCRDGVECTYGDRIDNNVTIKSKSKRNKLSLNKSNSLYSTDNKSKHDSTENKSKHDNTNKSNSSYSTDNKDNNKINKNNKSRHDPTENKSKHDNTNKSNRHDNTNKSNRHDNTNKIHFKESIFIKAVREGWWVILDELNLAQSEVLEVLNRLLDDNREIYISATNTLVKAHPDFRIFATQNIEYSGRKQMSKAFRNRFIEITFYEKDENELLEIIQTKTRLPKRFCTYMVQVYTKLKNLRNYNSLVTLRDLFRWSRRLDGVISEEDVYNMGMSVIYERQRNEDDKSKVREVFDGVFKNKVFVYDMSCSSGDSNVYSSSVCERCSSGGSNVCSSGSNVYDIHNNAKDKRSNKEDKNTFENTFIYTKSVNKLLKLMSTAIKYKEPILLIGETGIGKTRICELLAEQNNTNLNYLNMHSGTESSDFIGTYTITNGKIEYKPGPLINSMIKGEYFLIDEINLAESATLERLNSLLEDKREIFVTETDLNVKAHDNFILFATMNPGNDFGKTELSPALRNRFTEIYFSLNEDEIYEISINRVRSGLRLFKDAMCGVDDVLCGAINDNGMEEEESRRSWSCREEKDGSNTKDNINNTKNVKNTRETSSNKEIASTMTRETSSNKKIASTMTRETFSNKNKVSTSLKDTQNLSHGTLRNKIRNYKINEIYINHLIQTILNSKILYGIKSLRKVDLFLEFINNYINKENKLINISDLDENELIKEGLELIGVTDDLYRMDTEVNRVGALCKSICNTVDDTTLSPSSNTLDDMNKDTTNIIMNREPTNISMNKQPTNFSMNKDTKNISMNKDTRNISMNKDTRNISMNRDTRNISMNKEPRNISMNRDTRNISMNRDSTLDINVSLDTMNRDNTLDIINNTYNITLNKYNTTLNTYNSTYNNTINIHNNTNVSLDTNTNNISYNTADKEPQIIETHPYSCLIKNSVNFNWSNATTRNNLKKILRALTVNKGILLEGEPGVGKTSMVLNLSKILKVPCVRINLSEQTELSDLVGSYIPFENSIKFVPSDLSLALKKGHWIILDEINLCSQSVLEGLNSVLDYRKTLNLPELRIQVHPKCKIFGTMNPYNNKNGRKILPRSLVDRFVSIYMEEYTRQDIEDILSSMFTNYTIYSERSLRENIKLNRIKRSENVEYVIDCDIRKGGNIRIGNFVGGGYYDGSSIASSIGSYSKNYSINNNTIDNYNSNDGAKISKDSINASNGFNTSVTSTTPGNTLTNDTFKTNTNNIYTNTNYQYTLIHKQLPQIEQILQCVDLRIPLIIKGSLGRYSLIKFISKIFNLEIFDLICHKEIDTSDILGQYHKDTDTFKWTDSPFVESIKKGSLVVLHNPELVENCIFDRCNSLFETERTLNVYEKGVDTEIQVHENTRFVMLVDCLYGISPAILDRCYVIELSTELSYIDLCKIFLQPEDIFEDICVKSEYSNDDLKYLKNGNREYKEGNNGELSKNGNRKYINGDDRDENKVFTKDDNKEYLEGVKKLSLDTNDNNAFTINNTSYTTYNTSNNINNTSYNITSIPHINKDNHSRKYTKNTFVGNYKLNNDYIIDKETYKTNVSISSLIPIFINNGQVTVDDLYLEYRKYKIFNTLPSIIKNKLIYNELNESKINEIFKYNYLETDFDQSKLQYIELYKSINYEVPVGNTDEEKLINILNSQYLSDEMKCITFIKNFCLDVFFTCDAVCGSGNEKSDSNNSKLNGDINDDMNSVSGGISSLNTDTNTMYGDRGLSNTNSNDKEYFYTTNGDPKIKCIKYDNFLNSSESLERSKNIEDSINYSNLEKERSILNNKYKNNDGYINDGKIHEYNKSTSDRRIFNCDMTHDREIDSSFTSKKTFDSSFTNDNKSNATFTTEKISNATSTTYKDLNTSFKNINNIYNLKEHFIRIIKHKHLKDIPLLTKLGSMLSQISHTFNVNFNFDYFKMIELFKDDPIIVYKQYLEYQRSKEINRINEELCEVMKFIYKYGEREYNYVNINNYSFENRETSQEVSSKKYNVLDNIDRYNISNNVLIKDYHKRLTSTEYLSLKYEELNKVTKEYDNKINNLKNKLSRNYNEYKNILSILTIEEYLTNSELREYLEQFSDLFNYYLIYLKFYKEGGAYDPLKHKNNNISKNFSIHHNKNTIEEPLIHYKNKMQHLPNSIPYNVIVANFINNPSLIRNIKHFEYTKFTNYLCKYIYIVSDYYRKNKNNDKGKIININTKDNNYINNINNNTKDNNYINNILDSNKDNIIDNINTKYYNDNMIDNINTKYYNDINTKDNTQSTLTTFLYSTDTMIIKNLVLEAYFTDISFSTNKYLDTALQIPEIYLNKCLKSLFSTNRVEYLFNNNLLTIDNVLIDSPITMLPSEVILSLQNDHDIDMESKEFKNYKVVEDYTNYRFNINYEYEDNKNIPASYNIQTRDKECKNNVIENNSIQTLNVLQTYLNKELSYTWLINYKYFTYLLVHSLTLENTERYFLDCSLYEFCDRMKLAQTYSYINQSVYGLVLKYKAFEIEEKVNKEIKNRQKEIIYKEVSFKGDASKRKVNDTILNVEDRNISVGDNNLEAIERSININDSNIKDYNNINVGYTNIKDTNLKEITSSLHKRNSLKKYLQQPVIKYLEIDFIKPVDCTCNIQRLKCVCTNSYTREHLKDVLSDIKVKTKQDILTKFYTRQPKDKYTHEEICLSKVINHISEDELHLKMIELGMESLSPSYLYYVFNLFINTETEHGTGIKSGTGEVNVSETIKEEDEISGDNCDGNEDGDGVEYDDMEGGELGNAEEDEAGEMETVKGEENEEEENLGEENEQHVEESEENIVSEGEEEPIVSEENDEEDIEEIDPNENCESSNIKDNDCNDDIDNVEESTDNINEDNNTDNNNIDTTNNQYDYTYKEGQLNNDQTCDEAVDYERRVFGTNLEQALCPGEGDEQVEGKDDKGKHSNFEHTIKISTEEIYSERLVLIIRNILENNKLNKYKGDYKNGKKLNMKKLIPYIASDYKKDKIWMRRKKNDNKDYTVRLFIDNSKSMYTPTLITELTKIFSKLNNSFSALNIPIEIFKFGNDLLKIQGISNLTFEDTQTNIEFIDEYKDGINIILTDGIFQNTSFYNSSFLVILIDKNDIRKMSKVSVVENEMIIQKYLDYFGLKYCIVERSEELENVFENCLSEMMRNK